ncbi:AzlC family ABC transporter permease [Caenibacillus caldisaponilyticus]|uniref:AzlC family ABC transporter permease n=1 Tax=Caenibacillus caldisaponilyticus TaxID=1674942 RepID=UPI00237A01C6|nr:AzlC family ABC transporter permease [Caenibacillus caldisaponilyticus]
MLSHSSAEKVKSGDWWSGVKAGIPIAIGYMPIALTFGLLARTTGLTFAEAAAMSLFVYAGASQFMALQMIAGGTGPLEIILATFIVNIRHFLMTASIGERMKEPSRLKRALIAYGITDETFSVASLNRECVGTSYMGGLIVMAYGTWNVFTWIGYAAGASLPGVLQKSMGIALYAMFIGLVVPSLKKERKALAIFLMSAGLSTLLSFFLSAGWAIVWSTLIAAVAVEILFLRKKSEVDKKQAGGGYGR